MSILINEDMTVILYIDLSQKTKKKKKYRTNAGITTDKINLTTTHLLTWFLNEIADILLLSQSGVSEPSTFQDGLQLLITKSYRIHKLSGEHASLVPNYRLKNPR